MDLSKHVVIAAGWVASIAMVAATGGCGDTYSNAYLDTVEQNDAAGDASADASATPDAVADATPDAVADATPDAVTDTVSDVAAPDAVDVTAPDADAETSTPDGAAPDATPDAVAEVVGPGACGNGTLESGEACDDNNLVSEWPPDMASLPDGACISDCSIDMKACGDGTEDTATGEQCDDGNDVDNDGCTSACTTNTLDIGDVCTATGIDEDANDFTTGTIVGCDSVPDSSGGCVKACLRSIDPGFNQPLVKNPGGYCTLLAVKCDGGFLCTAVAQPGDFDTCTTCPAGSHLEQGVTEAAGLTITTKSCLQICTTQADCRWRQWDSRFDEWGQYQCVPADSDPTVSVCKPTQSP